jgi:hypothetical protein
MGLATSPRVASGSGMSPTTTAPRWTSAPAGDAVVIEPGHDAWVVGDEPLTGYNASRPPPLAVGAELGRGGWRRGIGASSSWRLPHLLNDAAAGAVESPALVAGRTPTMRHACVAYSRVTEAAASGAPRGAARCEEARGHLEWLTGPSFRDDTATARLSRCER